jgi:hypothetical protein
MNPVFLASNPRDISFYHRYKATGVKMTPLAMPVVIWRAVNTTARARKSGLGFMGQFDGNLGFQHLEIHIDDLPRGLQAK